MLVITRRFAAFAAAALVFTASLAFAQSPPGGPPVRLRGTVDKVDGNTVMLKLNNGQDATMKLGDNVRVAGLVKIGIADVPLGSYVGVSSMPQSDGSLKAISIHIFPDAQRGVAEGHGPWDNRPGAVMTNANLETKVAGNNGDTLVLKYKTGEQKVLVGPDAVIVRVVPGDRSELVPGAKIWSVARKEADGSFTPLATYVGRNGLTPPM